MAIGPVPPYVAGGPPQFDFLQRPGLVYGPDTVAPAQQLINVGSNPGDQTGDPGRLAWQKANLNFTQLYKSRYTFPGNVLNYGADPTGLYDSAPAFTAAIAANDYVYIPSGIYLINSQINVNKSHITIEGANQSNSYHSAWQGGSLLTLGAAAGSGAAVFAWTGIAADYQAINLRRFGIVLQNAGLQQIGIRFNQCVGVRLIDLVIGGQGTTADDTTGILFDGLIGVIFQYTGDVDICRCYITNHLIGISLQGSCTTMRILNNELYGTVGHATNIGVLLGNASFTNAVITPTLRDNTFDQWSVGIQSYAQAARQLSNHFEGCTTGLMGNNWAISAITKAASAVVTISTGGTVNPWSNFSYPISGISIAASAVVTVTTVATVNPFSVNAVVSFSGVNGMTQINGLTGTVTAIGGVSGAWTATVNINSSGFSAYTSSGQMATGGIGNAYVFAGIVGMVEMNGLQGVITAIAGVSGAWTATFSINSTAFTTYTSGGTAQGAMCFNWVRGLGMTNIQNSSIYDTIVTGAQNFPQNSTDRCTFLGPSTSYFGSLDASFSQGQLLYFNSHAIGNAVKIVYDGTTLSSSAPFYCSLFPTVAYAMNGAVFGQIQQLTVSPDSWGLGSGASQTAVGATALRWRAAGIAVSVTGINGTHSFQITDSAVAAFNGGYLETPVGNHATPYTAVLADSGKLLYYNGTGAAAFTIPANASVAYPVGTELTFVNDATGATNMTIAITTDTMILSPGGTTGSRTLAQFGRAKAVKLTATRWLISGSGLT